MKQESSKLPNGCSRSWLDNQPGVFVSDHAVARWGLRHNFLQEEVIAFSRGAGVKIAVDLNPETRKYLTADVEFHQRRATELGAIIEGGADAVFTSNFLKHLPDKHTLDLFLDQVMITLKSGGKYLILGPNLRCLPGKYWDFYDHHLGLTHLSLSEALQLKGFEIQLCIGRFLPFTTQGTLPTHPFLVWAYLKLPLAWRLFGKQFFIVARKPLK